MTPAAHYRTLVDKLKTIEESGRGSQVPAAGTAGIKMIMGQRTQTPRFEYPTGFDQAQNYVKKNNIQQWVYNNTMGGTNVAMIYAKNSMAARNIAMDHNLNSYVEYTPEFPKGRANEPGKWDNSGIFGQEKNPQEIKP